MAGAIRKVLPGTVHRWCIWHIMKKSQFKFGGYTRYGELNAKMNHIRVPILFKSEFWDGMRSHSRVKVCMRFMGGFCIARVGWFNLSMNSTMCLKTRSRRSWKMMLRTRKESSHDPSTGGKKKTDCMVQSIEQQGTSISVKTVFWENAVYHTFTVDFDRLSQKVRCECNKFESTGILCCHTLAVWLYYRVYTVPSYYVLPQWSKNVIRKHTYIKISLDVVQTDESHNLFKCLCSEFYNVAQEFVGCNEEAAILRSTLWDAKSKLIDYRANMHSPTLTVTQNTMHIQSTSSFIVHDIQEPSRVKTKRWPKSKRLGAELDKSIKKLMQKRKRKPHPVCARSEDVVDLQTDNNHDGSVNKRFEHSTTWNSLDGGRFIDLLNSFRHR
ncbi:hypothetical protein Ahy_A05g025612 [Arachis hypogaea]|uniref:SWIM-type domain-containing protein n=1 Tax=Arachis hypogaea TaxID=3818 RepID=A0A445D948_ARAHY|nr:hypothetical protein Ahy_A05g025612 [Arachis hypogaea]